MVFIGICMLMTALVGCEGLKGDVDFTYKTKLESKCQMAYIQTLKTNLMAKDAGLPYDENMTRLKEICGDSIDYYLIKSGDIMN